MRSQPEQLLFRHGRGPGVAADKALDVAALRALRLLVADPVSAMTELTAAALRGIGVGTVVKVTDSRQAMQALTKAKFSAIILAEDLRPFGATKLTALLRGMPDCVNVAVPVIAVGNVVYRSMIEDAIKGGISRFIRRPVSADMLRACLLSVLPPAEVEADRHYL